MHKGRNMTVWFLSSLPSILMGWPAGVGPEAPLAYLDPGSGSYLLQLLAAGALGGLFVIKMSWSRIKGFFGRLFGRRGERPTDE